MSSGSDPSRASLAGTLAGELAGELAAPMQGLRDRLALLVDHIDRYISHSTGPTPYPWQALQGLRHELGGAYLEATLLVRQLGDVRAVLAAPQAEGRAGAGHEAGAEVGHVDCAHEVEVALNLLSMKHTTVELIADVGLTPPVRAEPGALALVITRLLWLCAQSVDGVPGSAISVRTWPEVHEPTAGPEAQDGHDAPTSVELVVVSIADNGHGLPGTDAELGALFGLIEQVVAGWHGSLGVEVTRGRGCSFELRLPVANRGGVAGDVAAT
jgi:signal transduction histidine kinase